MKGRFAKQKTLLRNACTTVHFIVAKLGPLNCSTTVYATVKYCMNTIDTIDTVAHTLQFNFHTITNQQAIDALVHALTIDLFINNRLECSHPCADRLVFASERDCTFAQLVLCSDTRFTLSRRID